MSISRPVADLRRGAPGNTMREVGETRAENSGRRVLVLDNHDSFVANLARYTRELGHEAVVWLSDVITLDDIRRLAPSHIIISPGPCTPKEAGVSTEVVQVFGPATPVLGVCLGHQCISEAYGGEVIRATHPMHGRAALVFHEGGGVFTGVPSPFMAARYHSLIVPAKTLPAELIVTAHDGDGEVMALRHREYPVVGVQFHPESAATEWGYRILANFLNSDSAVAPWQSADLGRSSASVVGAP